MSLLTHVFRNITPLNSVPRFLQAYAIPKCLLSLIRQSCLIQISSFCNIAQRDRAFVSLATKARPVSTQLTEPLTLTEPTSLLLLGQSAINGDPLLIRSFIKGSTALCWALADFSESELLYDWRFTASQFVLAPSTLRITARFFLFSWTLAVIVLM
jgi:hypothetical protein